MLSHPGLVPLLRNGGRALRARRSESLAVAAAAAWRRACRPAPDSSKRAPGGWACWPGVACRPAFARAKQWGGWRLPGASGSG
eukprot:2426340-Alexandrium_andersonii.AAC.1